MTESTFPKIFIVVLNFNGGLDLINCLNSVFHSDYPNFEMVVVDNNSKDGSFEQAKNTFSRSHFISIFNPNIFHFLQQRTILAMQLVHIDGT